MSHITPLGITREFISQNPRLFALYCVFSIGIVINNIFVPRYYGYLINDIKEGTVNKTTVVGIVALMVLSQLFIFANDIMEIKMYPALHSYLRDISLKNIVESQSRELSEVESGKFVSRITKFQTIFTGLFDDFRNNIFLFLIVYLFAIGYTFKADTGLGIVCLILVCIVVYATYNNLHECSAYSTQRDAEFYKMVGGLDDMMTNITNVLNHNTYEYENARLKETEQDIARHSNRALGCSYRYKVMVLVAIAVCSALFVWRCISLSNSNRVSSATIIAISIMMIYVLGIVLRNISIFKDISYRYGTLKEILRHLNADIGNPTDNGEYKSNDNCRECLISLRDVCLYGDNNHKILKDVNLDINRGESIVITGGIGSGKSSLLKLLLKYRSNYTGTITFNGTDYRNISPYTLREEVYYIDQKCVLFNRSILENIQYGTSKSRDDVETLIQQSGLTEFFSRFIHGIDTGCGIAGSRLSGGERQIVVLLRMLLRDPEVVLLDEPTSAMDVYTREHVLILLSGLISRCTVICITHDEEIATRFNRRIHMQDGKLVPV
jgi:ABC-type bacteriocin/lantibiotic exporter with double-glycine peptidase domain